MNTIRRRGAWWAGAAAVLLGASLLAAARPGGAGAAEPPAKGEPPAELAFVPGDAGGFATVRFADVWNHEVAKASREKVLKEWPDAFKEMTKTLGVAPEEIERLTGVAPTFAPGLGGDDPFAAVTTRMPCDQKKVLAAVVPDAKEEKVKDRDSHEYSLYANGHGQAAVFLDDRTYLLGSDHALKAFLERPAANKDGALTPALRLAGEKHVAVAGLDVAALSKVIAARGGAEDPELKPLKPLLRAERAELTVDLAEQARGDLRLTFSNEADARDADKALKAERLVLVPLLAGFRKTLEKDEEMRPVVALLTDVQAGLNSAKVERDGSAVDATMTVRIDPKAVPEALVLAAVNGHKNAIRAESANNLRQLTLGMINYADDHKGVLPAQAIYDKSGKPLLSWRVQILPYIEGANLYKEFRLDEPWDSDHNKKLLEKMPPVFAMADSEAAKNHETFYQGFVGPGAFFEGKAGLRFPADFPDGTSNTFMLVEAAKAVPWTKPEDIPFDDGKLGPRLGGVFKDGYHVSFCDGSSRFFRLPVRDEKMLRIAITRNDGMVIDFDKLEK
jgi:hypothetical protein